VATTSPMLIPAPPVPPRPYGLFDVSLGPMPFPVPAAQGNGVEYIPDTCEDDVFLYAMNCPPVSGSKTFSGIETPVTGAPFGVITSYTCSTIGFTFEEIEQRVRTRMMLREQRAVERRVWQGSPAGGIGGIPGLFQSATTLTAASCPTDAVAALEQALADNGVVGGIIHARPYMSAHIAQAHVADRISPRQIVTLRGTPVCFGEGYDGTGPQGQAVTATVEYMYASGRVAIWASDVEVPDPRQTMDRSLNQQKVLAERIFAVTVECGVWAIAVTRDCGTTGATP
jgi:hypothetical protein